MNKNLTNLIPAGWRRRLAAAAAADSFKALEEFLAVEWESHEVFPPRKDIFAALEATAPETVKAVIIGQDPYHGEGQAHGLCFSVPNGARIPPSLRNIFKELAADLNISIPADGDLSPWTGQGVLLLNTVLTVRSGQANSHQKHGWEQFTDAIIEVVNRQNPACAFILWGAAAAAKADSIDKSKHLAISSPHPSPLSAHRGFFGSRPFSKTNEFLSRKNLEPIDWRLPTATENHPDLF